MPIEPPQAPSLHVWMTPRLQGLIEQAARAGFGREAVVATIIDIIGSSRFNDAATPDDGA